MYIETRVAVAVREVYRGVQAGLRVSDRRRSGRLSVAYANAKAVFLAQANQRRPCTSTPPIRRLVWAWRRSWLPAIAGGPSTSPSLSYASCSSDDIYNGRLSQCLVHAQQKVCRLSPSSNCVARAKISIRASKKSRGIIISPSPRSRPVPGVSLKSTGTGRLHPATPPYRTCSLLASESRVSTASYIDIWR